MRNFIAKCKRELATIYNFLTHEQEIFYFSASLSFYTIFAILPFLLIVLSIISNLPSFQNKIADLKNLIISNIIPTNTEMIAQMLDSLMRNPSQMGIVGFIYIIVTSLLFFRNYEFITSRMFNSKPRGILDSLKVYWVMITFFPVMLALMFYLSNEIKDLLFVRKQAFFFTWLLSWLLACVSFLALFLISANKTLNKKILLISSFSCASIWYFLKWGFFYYISYNTTYPSLYGSISVLLTFMLWVYISWAVLLFGMRVCEGISIVAETKKDATQGSA